VTLDQRAAQERERLDDEENEWLRARGRCRCRVALLDRAYLGRWSCRRCGLLTVVCTRTLRVPSVNGRQP